MADTEASYSIYAIRCRETGRVYVGSSCNVQRRILQHFSELKAGKKIKTSTVRKVRRGEEWQADYDKYGASSFDFYILEDGLSFVDRRAAEAKWIRKYKACDPAHGYNSQCQKLKAEALITITEGMPPLPEEK